MKAKTIHLLKQKTRYGIQVGAQFIEITFDSPYPYLTGEFREIVPRISLPGAKPSLETYRAIAAAYRGTRAETAILELIERVEAAEHDLADERMEHNLLQELLSRPEIDDFWEGIVTEAAHQRQRWGDAHDRDKSAENWFWLIGYLSGKALRAAIEGDKEKAKHHTISTAAALFQWHQAIKADESGCSIGKDEDIDPAVGRLGDKS